MRTEGSRWRSEWGKGWDRNVGVVRGELWPDKSSRPVFLANLISPTVRRKAGLLVESKPGLDVRTRRSGLGVTADVLRHTSEAVLDEQNVSMVWETLAYYLAAFGCGFWKIGYDPMASFGEGDIALPDVDPRLMLIDPAIRRATDIQRSQYLIEESVVPYSWVRERFPRTSADVEPDADIKYETNDTHKISWYERLIDKVRRTAGAHANEESAVPRVYLQECWVADASMNGDKRIYPGGRRIWLTGDDVILNPNVDHPEDPVYGQSNPFWDGQWPYVMLDNEPDLDHPFGHAEVEALRKLNEAFNAVGHMTTRTLIKNVPYIIADAGSIDAATLQDLKELEEVLIEKTPGRSVDRVAPTQPTATNISFMQLMITLIEMYAGLNDGALQGKGRVELRSQPQLEGLQQASQVLIRAQARRLESMIERGGQLLISRLFQYYTSDRILTYIDSNTVKQYEFQKDKLRDEIIALAASQVEAKAIEETNANLEAGQSLKKALVPAKLDHDQILQAIRGAWRLFRFKVIPFSTLASTKIQRAMLLEQLVAMGAIPQALATKEAGFDNPEELMQQRAEELKKMTEMGIPPPAPPGKDGGKKR